jgi:hypothetical protein
MKKSIITILIGFLTIQIGISQDINFYITTEVVAGSDVLRKARVFATNNGAGLETIGAATLRVYYTSSETTFTTYNDVNLGGFFNANDQIGSIPAASNPDRYVDVNGFTFGIPVNPGSDVELFNLDFTNTSVSTDVNLNFAVLAESTDAPGLVEYSSTVGGPFNVIVINGKSQTLPISLSQFTAEKINERSARLFWETTSEVNSDYFIIQRSTDTENWESLGRVDAIGTPTSTQSYEFIDNTIPTTLRSEDNIFFYRLAMVDLDEQYELSAIRTLSFEGTSGIINIYPNPTAQNLIVDLTSVEGNSKIQLIDIQGRLIFEQKVTDEYNDIPVLNLRDMGLDNGTYLISYYRGLQ